MEINIARTGQKRIVVVGAGFGGLKLAQSLRNTNVQVVLLDRNNYHMFQPLFYQVATAGLEPSSISFPLRKIFHNAPNIHIRVAEVRKVDVENKMLSTSIGTIEYDYLVLAMGADSNYFGMQNVKKHALPMKSTSEALALRNCILQNLEDATQLSDLEKRKQLLTIVVAGGGATGVEVSGTLAEMKNNILPKDYPELDFSEMTIHLIEGSPRVLNVMREISSIKSKVYLEKLGVKVKLNAHVKDYDGHTVVLANGEEIKTNTLIWAAGVAANKLEGIPAAAMAKNGRIKVNQFNQIEGIDTIFAIGDMALMSEEKYQNGHPQVAQPAIQQGKLLAKNIQNLILNKPMKSFVYSDLGSMATVGKNKAVVELTFIRFQGVFAWLTWMFVHLMSIVGVKNRLLIFINWVWHYFSSDQSLRLIMKPSDASSKVS